MLIFIYFLNNNQYTVFAKSFLKHSPQKQKHPFYCRVFTENELPQHGKRVVIFKQAHCIPLGSNVIHIQVNSLGHGLTVKKYT